VSRAAATLAVAVTLVAGPGAAGQAPRPTKPAPALGATVTPAADREARAGRAALERGDAAGALKLIEPVLAREPGHPLAAAVKVESLIALGERGQALDAYDAWFKAVGAEEPALLTRLAVAELQALQSESLLHVDALAALAQQRGAPGVEARSALKKLATADPPTTRSWPAIVALCRIGDDAAATRALQAYRASTGSGRVRALEAVIASGPAKAEPVLREALATKDAMLQSTAADGAATLQLKSLVPALQETARNGEMFAKFSAAVALAQLGATGGESLLDAAATSPAMDARYKAALARKARGDKGWVDAMRPLLASGDAAVKYQAAAALLAVDRPAAMKVLQAGTTDPNPAVRTLVADALTRDPSVPVSELRRLLRDGVARVRLFAASAILRRPPPPR
jgi:HEAT repeat protein